MSYDKDRCSDDERSRKRPNQQQQALLKSDVTSGNCIDMPADNDVLFGRGAPIIRWQGNVKFRELVRQRKAEYLATRRHAHKDTIAREIIEEIETNRRGRFLKRAPTTSDSNIEDDFLTGVPRHWMLAETELIIEKVKQALRDKDIDGTNREMSAARRKRKEAEGEAEVYNSSNRTRIEPIVQPSMDAAERQASHSISQPVAMLPRPHDNQSQILTELQRRLQAQTAQQQQSILADLIRRDQQGLPGGMPFGFLAPFAARALPHPPNNNLMLYLELLRQQNLFQQLPVPNSSRLQQQAPSVVDPMEAAVAWLRVRQDADAQELQQQNMERAMQETLRWLAPPVATAAASMSTQLEQQTNRGGRPINTPASSSGVDEESQRRAAPKQEEQSKEDQSSDEKQP